MDLVSLSIIVGVFLGLVTADAAFVSDRVKECHRLEAIART